MNDHPLISQSGFTGTDCVVLNSIFNIVKNSRSELEVVTDHTEADIVFVNGDDPHAKGWISAMLETSSVTVVDVAKANTAEATYCDGDRVVSIKKPITLRRANDVFNLIFTQSGAVKSESSSPLSTAANVLIVDDSFLVRNYMDMKVKELSRNRLSVVTADSGKAAIELLKENQFDLVFLDVVMPGIDGYKVCRWIKSTFPTTKVVMLSGKKTAFDKVRGSISGCDAYITKPPEDGKIKSVLDSIQTNFAIQM